MPPNTTPSYSNTRIYRCIQYIISSLFEACIKGWWFETLRWLTELYVSVVLTLFILHEFMLENIARVQGSAPSGAVRHRNTLRKAL